MTWCYTSEIKYLRTAEMVEMGDERLHIITEMLHYSVKNPRFDTTYTERVLENLVINGLLKIDEYNSLVDIYYSFKMDQNNAD